MAYLAKKNCDELIESMLQMVIRDHYNTNPAQLFNTLTANGTPIRKLYVGNLAIRTTEKDLLEVFSLYGKVDGCVLTLKAHGNKYAIITFSDADGAILARQDAYRKEIKLHDRILFVFPAIAVDQPDSVEYKIKLNLEKENKCLITRLNNDCLEHIFTFLPIHERVRIERVCKRWREVSLNSWQTLRHVKVHLYTLNHTRDVDVPTLKKFLLKCGPYLTDISCDMKRYRMSEGRIRLLTELCPNIQKLDIAGTMATSEDIKYLAETYFNLTELKVQMHSKCEASTRHIQNNKKLKILHIIEHKTDSSFVSLLPHTIEELCLSHCKIPRTNFSAGIRRLDKLRILKVSWCNGLQDVDFVLSHETSSLEVLHGILPAVNNLPQMVHLKVLNITQCHDLVTDSFLCDVVVYCVRLTEINISECKRVTAGAISKLFSLPNLEHLYMTHLSIEYFVIDKSNVPLQLKILDCSYNEKLREEYIFDVIELAPSLELLNFKCCVNMTNYVVRVARLCTQLRTNNILLILIYNGTQIYDMGEKSPLLRLVRH